MQTMERDDDVVNAVESSGCALHEFASWLVWAAINQGREIDELLSFRWTNIWGVRWDE